MMANEVDKVIDRHMNELQTDLTALTRQRDEAVKAAWDIGVERAEFKIISEKAVELLEAIYKQPTNISFQTRIRQFLTESKEASDEQTD